MTLVVGIVNGNGAVMASDTLVTNDEGEFVSEKSKFVIFSDSFVVGISGKESVFEAAERAAKFSGRIPSGGAHCIYNRIRESHNILLESGEYPPLPPHFPIEMLIIEPTGQINNRFWRIRAEATRKTNRLPEYRHPEKINDGQWSYVPRYWNEYKEIFDRIHPELDGGNLLSIEAMEKTAREWIENGIREIAILGGDVCTTSFDDPTDDGFKT